MTSYVPEPLTVAEASTILGKSTGWIWERIKTGQIEHVVEDRGVFISAEEVERVNVEGCE